MNLNDVVKSGVERAFLAAKDFVSLGTYVVRTGAAVYDPTTDTMSGGETTHVNVRMIRSSSQGEEREASPVTVRDVKVLIPASDLPGVEPSETDSFTMDTVEYNVIMFKSVPGNSLWIVFGKEK